MIQLSSKDRAAFYRRTAVSVGLFAFFLSAAANVFFLSTRNTPKTPEQGIFVGGGQEEPLLMGPVAFGQVQRGFVPKFQKSSASGAFLPVASYVLPDGMVPQTSGALPLFRDQGVPLDESEVQRVFDRLGVTLGWRDLQLLPLQQRWRTADRLMEIALDIEKRALTVTRTGSFSPSAEGRASDDATIAIAREFSMSLGIDPVSYGTPKIVERSTEPGGPLKTYVIWPMIFNGVPLLDAEAQSVPAVQVQVGRLSRKALSMTVTLLRPDRMSQSAYPWVPKPAIIASLQAGGLLPIAKDAKGTKTDVVYTSLAPSFVLLLGDREFPTYIVPTLLVEFKQGNVTGRTFVPALSESQFLWRPVVKTMSSASLAATGAIKTASGSTKTTSGSTK